MTNKLYLTNLASGTTLAELKEIFGKVGPYVSVTINTDPRTGAKLSYGFVEMETQELTDAALRHVNGYLLHDRRIMITELKPRHDREMASEVEAGKSQGTRRVKNTK
jgi:RNA recognition motif-containing protein